MDSWDIVGKELARKSMYPRVQRGAVSVLEVLLEEHEILVSELVEVIFEE